MMRACVGTLPWSVSHYGYAGVTGHASWRSRESLPERCSDLRGERNARRDGQASLSGGRALWPILGLNDEGPRKAMTELADTFDAAFSKAVDLGNRIADKDKDADLWDIADGLLAGAIQYWLYSRQPCGDPRCQDCMPISTAQGRMAELNRLIGQLASESEYFHTPTDANAGRA
jgi:hypothetical protein